MKLDCIRMSGPGLAPHLLYGAAEQALDGRMHVAERGLQRADVLVAVGEAHVVQLRQLRRVDLFRVAGGGGW